MACRRAYRPWWGVGERMAAPPSDSTCRVSRAQVDTGKREPSTWLRPRSSFQALVGGSAGMGAGAAGLGVCSTGATKKPRLGRV